MDSENTENSANQRLVSDSFDFFIANIGRCCWVVAT
jgi:hypothetical protein